VVKECHLSSVVVLIYDMPNEATRSIGARCAAINGVKQIVPWAPKIPTLNLCANVKEDQNAEWGFRDTYSRTALAHRCCRGRARLPCVFGLVSTVFAAALN